jgi:hypothetical protein
MTTGAVLTSSARHSSSAVAWRRVWRAIVSHRRARFGRRGRPAPESPVYSLHCVVGQCWVTSSAMDPISRRSFFTGAAAATAAAVPGCERGPEDISDQRRRYVFFNADEASFIEASRPMFPRTSIDSSPARGAPGSACTPVGRGSPASRNRGTSCRSPRPSCFGMPCGPSSMTFERRIAAASPSSGPRIRTGISAPSSARR